MPRLNISVSRDFAAGHPDRPAGAGGRAVRRLNAVAGANLPRCPWSPVSPRFLELLAALAIAASLGMAAALWRLFHFPH